jgi:hypothetical protein
MAESWVVWNVETGEPTHEVETRESAEWLASEFNRAVRREMYSARRA